MINIMSTRINVIEKLKKELPYLRANFGIKKIGIFGSIAKGVQRPDSDIDIVVEFEKPLGFKFMDFAEYLEKILGNKVDILTSEGIKSIRIKKVASDIERSIIYV